MTATANLTTSHEPPRPDPVAAARALHARFAIEAPAEIEVELLAWHCGGCVLWRHAGSADARVVRSGSRALFAIAAEARGTPRARFSVAHELGHLLMHPDCDAIERIHGGALTEPREFRVEREADRFASELLLPERFARSRCAAVPRPTLEDVGQLARDFRVSLTVAAQQWPRWTGAPCAFFEARVRDGHAVVRKAVRSLAFGGEAVGRRRLAEGSLALAMLRPGSAASARGPRMHDEVSGCWGSQALGHAIVEECVPAADGVIVGWLRHE